MMVRGLKDKAPKGSYVIRCGVLDRMVENKVYYKFLEYGAKVKAEQEAKREKLEEEEKKKLEEQSNYKSNGSLKLFNSSQSKEKLNEPQKLYFNDSEEEDKADVEQGSMIH